MRRMYGNIILPYSTANSNLSSYKKPNASAFIKAGIKITPSIEIKPKIIKREKNTIVTSSSVFFFLPLTPIKIGINTLLNEPSANIRLSIFGIVNASKKAWATGPEPRKRARKISRKNPNIRLKSVQRPTIEKLLIREDFFVINFLAPS